MAETTDVSFPADVAFPAEAAPAKAPGARRADLIYQSVTVAAILLVLGSLWLF
jgi:hypothetical protein